MSSVAVVGGGYAGLAAAVRLAKLGHAVTLLEGSSHLGGAMQTVGQDGFTWEAGPTYTLLPAVARDLFRKSGRPLERELELQQLPHVREHWFRDGSEIRLPSGRAEQADAWDVVKPGLGAAWTAYVDSLGEDWEDLRQTYFEVPWTRDRSPRLDARDVMAKRLKKAFKDERQRLVAGHLLLADGHDLRDVPAWAGLTAYLEQKFGVWTAPGGMSGLTAALVARLDTREVTVRLDVPVTDLFLQDGRVAGVHLAEETVDADVVVVAIDPRRLPALAPLVARTLPTFPPFAAHLGLDGPLPESFVGTHEVVIHGDPLLVVRPGGTAPEGQSAITVHARGRIGEDVVSALARDGIDLRGRVVTQLTRTPLDMVKEWGGSPVGMLWQGRGTVRDRLGPATPIEGVYAVGASATPGSGLPYVGLGAAQVATFIGPA